MNRLVVERRIRLQDQLAIWAIRVNLSHHLGSLAQHREAYDLSCWYLHGQDTLDMWEQYGHDGVAVCSRYELLKAALDGLLDEVHLGLVQYGMRLMISRVATRRWHSSE